MNTIRNIYDGSDFVWEGKTWVKLMRKFLYIIQRHKDDKSTISGLDWKRYWI